MKKAFLTLLSIALALSIGVTACTPPEEPEPLVYDGVYGPEWDRVVEAARQEGELVGYTSFCVGTRGEAVQAAFGDEYGITISGVSGLSAEIHEKVRTEVASGTVEGDIWDGIPPVAALAVDEGLNQEFVSRLPEYTASYPDEWRDDPMRADGYVINVFDTPFAPMINTDLVTGNDTPTSWLDLLDPKWKGQLVIDSPTLQGTLYRLYYIFPSWGIDPDWYFTKLGENEPVVTSNVYVAANEVADGNYAIAVMGYYQYLYPRSHLPIQFCSMEEGWTLGGGTPFMLIEGAPHYNAALVFLNWCLTTEGVTTLTEAAGQTVTKRTDTDDYWNMDLVTGNISEMVEFTYDEWLEIKDLQPTGTLEDLMGLPPA